MTLFLNLFRDGSFLDTAPQADAAVMPVKLSDESARTLAALLSLESYPLAKALAEVFLAGVTAGERAVRRSCQPCPAAGGG